VNAPVEGVDARTDRVTQSTVGVVLLAAFVFGFAWAVPAFVLILGVSALAGPRANALNYVFERWIAPRIPRRFSRADPGVVEPPIPYGTVRAQDALGAVVLLAASFAFALGVGVAGWLLTVAEAVAAIVAATTRLHVADRLRRAK